MNAKYVARRIAEGNRDEHETRLVLALEALLIGPTCGAEATRLVALLVTSSTHTQVALRLLDAANAFLQREHDT